MYFGHDEGYCAFDPTNVIRTAKPPTLVFGDLLLNNKSVALDSTDAPLRQVLDYSGTIKLTHRQNVVTFAFSALNFADPKRTRFRYRLNGL